jgi:hypothetical protein
MMLAYRLVRLIETHSGGLAAGLLAKVQNSEFTRDYRNVPPEDLQARVFEIYRHLGDWLLGKSEFDIRSATEIGERRAEQHVPLSQVVWARADQGKLMDYLKQEAGMERPTVLWELEMLQLLTSSSIARFSTRPWLRAAG